MSFPFTLSNGGVMGTINYDMQQTGGIAALIPAIAWEPNTDMSIGLSMFVWGDGVTAQSAFTKKEATTGTITLDLSQLIPNAAGPVNINDSLSLEQTYVVDTGYSFHLGFMWQFATSWKFGAVIKPSYTLDLKRTTQNSVLQVDANNGTIYNNINTLDESSAELTFPTVLALGLARSFGDTTVVSTDITYTNWADYEIVQDGVSVNPVSGLSEKSSSTLAFRLGLEHLLIREKDVIALRAGAGIDPEPAETNSDLFYTLSLGTGYVKNDWVLDWALQTRFGFNVGKSAYKGIDGEAVVTQVKSTVGVTRWF